MITAPMAMSRGLPGVAANSWPNPANVAGRTANEAIATSTAEMPAEMKKALLIAVIPDVSLARNRVMNTPRMATSTPMPPMISGKTRPSTPHAARPRINAATSVTAYDSNRSAAIPAQSPTLSPTLSAMVAALRGSSSGMFCSTLPTRSAPTSAALVKMPPPTRMNMASRAAPKPKPSSTVGALPR